VAVSAVGKGATEAEGREQEALLRDQTDEDAFLSTVNHC